MRIHQLVPALHEGDAIGDSARAMRDHLQSLRYESSIYAYQIDENISGEAFDFRNKQPAVQNNDLLILHFALPSGMTDFLKQAECKKALIYHNITPAYFWLDYDASLVHLATAGRKQLETLAPFVDRAAGDSEYNRIELEELNFRNTCVLPIYVNRRHYEVAPSRLILDTMKDGLFNFLFVGRVAPNKKLEDVLKIYFYYKRMYDPLSRVVFVGKTSVAPGYYSAVKSLVPRLGLLPEDVIFTGYVDWSELVAYYKTANAFVSMSEHEGFCVPLVEAMICETPIVAYSCTAIPFTLGTAGVQFESKDFVEIAGVCHRLRQDDAFRNSVLLSQRQQLENFTKEKIEKSIEEFISPFL